MRRVRISNCRMLLMSALLDLGFSAAMVLRDGKGIENLLDDVLGRDVSASAS